MRRVRSFFGGIYPENKKKSSAGTPIQILLAPETLAVPLLQYSGTEAKPVVAKGDEVLKGQMLAEAGDAGGAPVHSPVSGKVLAIEPRPHQSGQSVTTIVLENDGQGTWVEKSSHEDPIQLDAAVILERIKEAGVVGMGGAGFPTALKLVPPQGITLDYLIINGCECDPYLTCDDRLMIEHPEDIILGVKLMAKALGVSKIFIAIQSDKQEAYAAMKAEAGAIEIISLPVKYPSGGEKQLIQAVASREVPSGKLPSDVGVIVQNVATAWAVAKALRDGEPVISRVVTVAGDPIGESKNFLALIGTPLADLIEAAGGFTQTPGKIVVGSALMGQAQFDLQATVTKTTASVLAFGEEASRTPEITPCIKCARCVDVCPARLLPLKLELFGRNDRFDDARELGALDCIECGACNYICPAKRPLLEYIRFAKREIIANEKKSS